MSVYFIGDVMDQLRKTADGSVQCVVTSPPYWGLRDYGVLGQLGLESSPTAYVERMVGVFREVRRVLAADGTLWLNLGNSYAGSRKGGNIGGASTLEGSTAGMENCRAAGRVVTQSRRRDNHMVPRSDLIVEGVKAKNLIGVAWLVAFALQADGWYLRADIIWHKTNPMPEAVRDRPTCAHEYLFLLTKSARYYYDFDAVKEPASENTHARRRVQKRSTTSCSPATVAIKDHAPGSRQNASFNAAVADIVEYRNLRSVWTVATQPYAAAHFATFPERLIRPCILAGSRPGDTVLDPFAGSGTVGVVASQLDRDAWGIDLNPAYADLARARHAKVGVKLVVCR